MGATDELVMEGNGVDSREVELHQAYYAVLRAKTAAERKEAEEELAAILARRHDADQKFSAIASFAMHGNAAEAEQMLEGDIQPFTDKVVSCHQVALETTVSHCGPFNDYSLRYSRLFANLCALGMSQSNIGAAIQAGCGKQIVV